MISPDCFLDTNILLRHITNDHPKLSPKAKLIINKVATKRIRAHVTSLVIHEIIYVLRYTYKVEKSIITKYLSALLSLPNLLVLDIDKKILIGALDDYKKYSIDFPDCLYARISLLNKFRMLSFDSDFKKLGISVESRI